MNCLFSMKNKTYSTYNIRMNTLSDYKYLLGETIIVYQLIEHDLRSIAALSIQGEYHSNLARISFDYKSMGQVVSLLSDMDKKRSNPLLNESDYKILSALVRKRNYYCHQCAIDFIYESDFDCSDEFKSAIEELSLDHKRMLEMQTKIENIKILLAKSKTNS